MRAQLSYWYLCSVVMHVCCLVVYVGVRCHLEAYGSENCAACVCREQ